MPTAGGGGGPTRAPRARRCASAGVDVTASAISNSAAATIRDATRQGVRGPGAGLPHARGSGASRRGGGVPSAGRDATGSGSRTPGSRRHETGTRTPRDPSRHCRAYSGKSDRKNREAAMHPTSNTALAYALGTHPEPNGRGSAGSFIMSSTMTLGLFLAGALGASAQDLTGTYLYQPSGGTVTLELQQSGGRLTGVLRGIDGTVNRLDGTFEDGRAIGTIYLTHGVGWFAVAAWGDGVRLLAAAIDPDTGTPDLSDGWQLDFTRASANGSGVSSTGG